MCYAVHFSIVCKFCEAMYKQIGMFCCSKYFHSRRTTEKKDTESIRGLVLSEITLHRFFCCCCKGKKQLPVMTDSSAWKDISKVFF